jgi:xanthosine utilization system XapX-like protein
MHWLAYIIGIWAAIYVTAIFIAFFVKLVLPIPPAVAALSGLVGGLLGVFYFIIKHADHPVQEMIDGVGRPQRPETGIGDVVGEEDFGGIIEELRDQEHGGEEAEDHPPDSTRQ